MISLQTLSLIAGAFLIGGYIPYIYDVVKRKIIPNRASWFIWAFSTTVLLFGVQETGTSEAIWVPVADAIGCILIFLIALPLGVGGWAKTDKISLGICTGSLLVWWLTGNAFIALVANLLVYVSGYIPTIKKVWTAPQSEGKIAWSLFFLGVILNLFVVIFGSDTGLAVWLYPVVLVVTVGTLYSLLWRKVV